MRLVRCDNCGEEEDTRVFDGRDGSNMQERRDDHGRTFDLCFKCAAEWDRKSGRLRKEKIDGWLNP